MRGPGTIASFVLLGALSAVATASAQPRDAGVDAAAADASVASAADAGAADAGAAAAATPADAGAPAADPEIARLEQQAAQVRALSDGTLAVTVDPATLFSVDLADPRAVAIEARRLTAIVEAATVVPPPLEAPRDAGVDAHASSDAGVDASAAAQVVEASAIEPPPYPRLWRARLDLDRARLAVLALPAEARARLLEQHAARQAGVDATEVARSAADARLEQAAEARREAEEQLRVAKSEAAKLVARERARLLGVKEKQAEFDGTLIGESESIAARAEEVLAWRRRVEEHIDARRGRQAEAQETDRLYGELVTLLRGEVRSGLSTALDDVSKDSRVPDAGPDVVDSAGAHIDRASLDRLRDEAVAQAAALRQRESTQHWARVTVLLEEVESLNRDRLALYPWLSPERADALTSFSAEGIAQARAEVQQVVLVVRHQIIAAGRWLGSWRDGSGVGTAGVLASFSLLKVLAVLGVFLWWRRRSDRRFESLAERAIEARKRSVRRRWVWAERLAMVAKRVHRAAEWLLLVWLGLRLAGPEVRGVLEAQLGWIVVGWSLGGTMVVNTADALAASTLRAEARKARGDLRLRSLRLVGRVVVAVGLTLGVTAVLVGKGTIYDWVLTTCWVAALPVLLALVAWWRPTIYARLEPRRKKNAVAEWVTSRREGWASFLAAAVGAGYLVGHAVARTARAYVGGFTLTRRLLAYWFRRGVSKQAKERTQELLPLEPAAYAALDPERAPEVLVATVADAALDRILDTVTTSSGGVVAIVGERGSGKTMLLRRVVDKKPGLVTVNCPPGGLPALRLEILRALSLPAEADDAAIAASLDALGSKGAILVDNAQRLVRSRIGGLDDLDALLALARASAVQATWLIAIGAVAWRFVERARGARPLFDELIFMKPWSEERIAELLQQRSAQAGVEPRFDAIAIEPTSSDDEERAEELVRIESSYYRLLWDYAHGNPAVALHFWRESLRTDAQGRHLVQLFSAPDTSDLERLPDPAVFTLRAVLQLELASQDELVASTGLAPVQVANALRYALFRGYIEHRQGRYRLHWTWYRAVWGFLVRRHLIDQPEM